MHSLPYELFNFQLGNLCRAKALLDYFVCTCHQNSNYNSFYMGMFIPPTNRSVYSLHFCAFTVIVNWTNLKFVCPKHLTYSTARMVLFFLFTASSLHLGDEILAVNNRSVQGLTHIQVVDLLKGAGSTITLLVHPNQALEDIFAASCKSPPVSLLSSVTGLSPYSVQRMGKQQLLPPAMEAANDSLSPSLRGPAKPLPPGWSKKLDRKTGHEYFEKCVSGD